MLIPKEVIYPGTFHYTGQDGKPASLTVTRQMIDHMHRQGNAMLQAGLSIPVPWEHQPDARPQTAAQRAAGQLQNNAGWVKTFFRQGDKLFATVDILDPGILKRLPTTIRYTSPNISTFTDGQNRKWQNVIAHLALTSRPRIVPQTPFPNIEAAMSLLPAPRTELADCDLSIAGLLRKKGNHWAPVYQAEFSTWAGINLADEPPPDKGKKPPGKPETPGGETMDKGGTDTTTAEGMPGEGGDQGGGIIDSQGNISVYQVICDALGCVVPPGADEDKCLTALYKHVMGEMKNKGLQMSDTMNQPNQGMNDLPPNPGSGALNTVQEQQPLYMSLEQIQAIPDAAVRTTAQAAHAILQERLEEYNQRRQARINALAARVPQKAREKLLSLAKVPITLQQNGKVHDPADVQLSILEDSLPDLRAEVLQRGGGRIDGVQQAHPEDGDVNMSQERADAVFNEFAGNTGHLTQAEIQSGSSDQVAQLAMAITTALRK